jgi:peptidoglycan L-alanyl-D-glutamate endopeptidase CwlK
MWALVASLGATYVYDQWQDRKKLREKALSLRGYGDIKGLHPAVRVAAIALVDTLRHEDGAPAYIAQGRRTAKQQAALYAQGRTKAGPIVTWTLRSAHQSGTAFDLGFLGMDPDDVPGRYWRAVERYAQELGLVWGGNWQNEDKPHLEA